MSKLIVIDGYIGQYYFSQQLIRNMLSEAEKGEHIQADISSLGGQLNHGLAIHDMFAEHGNVSSKLYGFIASAATLIALPTKTRISKNAFYLIHKVLTWVDEWGNMNEDDIDQLIEKLAKEKDEVAKMTLVCAKLYYERAKTKGKSMQDVLNLMKQDTWLTAAEAEEWGFVDEVYEPSTSEKINSAIENSKIMAMISAEGMPMPPRQKTSVTNPNTMKKSLVLPQLNQVLNITELVCDAEDQGSFMSEDFINAIESELENRSTQINTANDQVLALQNTVGQRDETISQLNAQIESLQQAADNAASLSTENETLRTSAQELSTQNETLQTQLADANSRLDLLVAKLKHVPAAAAIILQADKDPSAKSDGPDWNTIDNLPHNKYVDNN